MEPIALAPPSVSPEVGAADIALKIQRRKYCRAALEEIYVFDVLRSRGLECPGIIELHEVFAHEGHVCMAFELHGKELDGQIPRDGMCGSEVKNITRQLLRGLQTMHGVDFAHSDIKPENVLYDPATGVAKLIDMSTADTSFGRGARVATREFTPPEVVLGTEKGTPMDIWSLACSIFYMLSGTVVFHPHKAAREKYVEFAPDWDDVEGDFEMEDRDDSDIYPDAELAPGDVLGGKYKLVSILGKGGFGTVWRCVPRHDDPVGDPSWKELENAEKVILDVPGDAGGETEQEDEDVDDEQDDEDVETVDMYDLVLYFEMLVQMEERIGPFHGYGAGGVYYDRYFNADGSYKFPADPKPSPIASTLIERAGMDPAEAQGWQEFLLKMLRFQPGERVTASDCLTDPWLG